MERRFIIKMAFRNIMARKLRSFLTLLGIAIGITAIVFLVAFGFGLERLVTEEVTGGDAFKLLDVGTGNSQIVSLEQKSIEQMKSFSNVKNAEFIINAGAHAIKDRDSKLDLSFFGTSPTYMNWLGLREKWGSPLSNSNNLNEVVVNTAYLKFMSLEPQNAVGKKASFGIIIPQEISGNTTIEAPSQEFDIVGVISDEGSPAVYANSGLLTSLGAKKYSQCKIEVNDQSQVQALRIQVENIGFKTQYVGDTVNQIGQVFNVFKMILGAFGLVALVVASLGMFNTLTISLLERTKEIALMKILGMRRRDINLLFLTEAIIFGALGGLLGILFGFFYGSLANIVLNYFAVKAGGDTVHLFYYPLWFVLIITAFSLIVGFLTGLYPARRATKLNALDVLRYE